MEISSFGKILISIGILLIIIGALLILSGKITWIGRLPGDICIKRENFSFYFPITTSILISMLLSLIFFFIGRK